MFWTADAYQDQHIVQAAMATSGHILHLLYHQGSLGTVCLQQDSDHMCLCPGYHLRNDTAKHGYSGVMKLSTGEWNSALLSSMMRVDSVWMRVMGVHVYSVDLVSVIFRSAFTHEHRHNLRLHGMRSHQLQLIVTFVVFAG